jgi:DNA-damage-inducible protein D
VVFINVLLRHTVMSDTQDNIYGANELVAAIQGFEQEANQDDSIYWDARQFMVRLGYDSWESFQKVINKAISSCAKLDIDATEAFVSSYYLDEDNKKCKTFNLTRFACFLVAMHADERKPEVAKAKVMLAALADQISSLVIQGDELGRLETRADLTLAERQMSGAAKNGGLESSQFGIFKDAGYRGMYNMSLKNLKKYKGVDGKKTLYDFMGLSEMAGNLFRLTQTTSRIESQNVKGQKNLNQVAREVGDEVRGMMIKNTGGIAPEDLPIEEPVPKVKTKVKRVHKKFERFDQSKKPK